MNCCLLQRIIVALVGISLLNGNGQVTQLANAQSTSLGMQTNFGGMTFAGGMAWEPNQDVIYITGQIGANACFAGIVKRDTLQFISKLELPEPAICQAITYGSQDTTALVLATTEEGGLFTDLRITGSTKATQYGLVVPLQWDAQGASPTMSTGLLLHENLVQYPRAILADPVDSDYFYVASLHSNNGALNSDFESSSDAVPNLTPSGLIKYGSDFYLQVERLQYNPLSTTDGSDALAVGWRKPFGLSAASNSAHQSVHIANMIWNNGALLIAGSTRGSGTAFGESEDGGLMNGYLTKLNPATGVQWQPTKAVQRFSKDDAQTYIEAVCSAGPDATEIFIAGMYTANPENGGSDTRAIPFLAKLDATTMETVWEEQFVFTKNAYGIACAVDVQGDYIYMAGIVEDGGTYGSDTTSLGQDDLFVLQSEISDGHSNWLRQLGTQGNDRLAHGGSGLIVADGGVVLFGDTSGDFQAVNQKGTEIYLAKVDSSGSVPTTTETAGNENTGGSVELQIPERLDGDTTNDGGLGNDLGDDNVNDDPSEAPVSSDDGDLFAKSGTGNGVGMIVAIVVLVVVLMAGYVMGSRKQEHVTERSLVFSYLHAFDLEDVDVRHSATGGWHGTYVGKLAKGEDRSGGSVGSLSHSSIVKDSLFVDYESSTPKFGEDYHDDKDNTSHSSFRIGSVGDEDNDEDFEEISQLNTEGNESSNAWGRDII